MLMTKYKKRIRSHKIYFVEFIKYNIKKLKCMIKVFVIKICKKIIPNMVECCNNNEN